MALKDLLNNANGTTQSSGSSSVSNSSRGLGALLSNASAIDERRRQLEEEARVAKEEAVKENSPMGLAKNTLLGIPRAAQSIGNTLIGDPLKTLVAKPTTRAIQATYSGAGALIGGDLGRRMQNAAEQPINQPTPFGGNMVIEPQKSGLSSIPQIAGDALKSASYLAPVGRVQQAGSALLKGQVRSAAAGGATAGAYGGLLGGAGEGLIQENPTVGSVVKSTALGGLLGAAAGGLLGSGGAALTRTKKLPPSVKLPVISDDVAQEVNVRRFKPLKVTGESSVQPVNTRLAYTPDNELPVIQAGSRTPEARLPVIKADSSPSTGSFSYEPIPQRPILEKPRGLNSLARAAQTSESTAPRPVASIQNVESAPQSNPVLKIQNPKTSIKPEPIRAVQGTGEMKTHGLSAGVEANAIEKRLVDDFGELPQYQAVSMKDQAEKATALLAQDYARARRVAMGLELPPEGIIPESVFTAIENKAIKDGDVLTLRDLSVRSSLTSEATTMGQRIRSLAERDSESPVYAIADLAKSRATAAAKRVKGDVGKMKKEIAKQIKSQIQTPHKESWSSFVDSITC